ncbi:transaldolase family protein [Lacticaseibacillus nasuensis]|uniref:Transaldolase n=1 Tax=Lacticaseibacillus nasuensis JCM 17158 TaxID=1291734 RepID=A0A0R1JQM5_9LACO|nr:transaldolase family protein [Lacticaseibacillus nasuensis]KRK70889.1 hypothetical protein FD02_GL000070 [Lacticaseibacillus nasuensis JCM 17158]
MDIWIASANQKVLTAAHAYPLSGIITNPTVIAQEQQPWEETFSTFAAYPNDRVHLQVVTTDEKKIYQEVAWFEQYVDKSRLIVKIPMSLGGLKAIPRLKAEGFAINVTAVCNMQQAVLALEAGIQFVSIYVARLNDHGRDGLGFLKKVLQYIKDNGLETQVMAASVRNSDQLNAVIDLGVDAIAMPYDLLTGMMADQITTDSIEKFATDWAKVN